MPTKAAERLGKEKAKMSKVQRKLQSCSDSCGGSEKARVKEEAREAKEEARTAKGKGKSASTKATATKVSCISNCDQIILLMVHDQKFSSNETIIQKR